MTNIARRVAELEKLYSPPKPPERLEIIAALYEGEPEEETVARWRAEHPDEPEPNFIILVPVALPADLESRGIAP